MKYILWEQIVNIIYCHVFLNYRCKLYCKMIGTGHSITHDWFHTMLGALPQFTSETRGKEFVSYELLEQ